VSEPDGFRDLVQVVVGETVAAAAEFTGEGPLAEPLATGGSVLRDDACVAEQPRIRPSVRRAGRGVRWLDAQHCGAGGRSHGGRGGGTGAAGSGRGGLAGHFQHQQADGQARERGEGAGRGGQPVGEDDWLAGEGLDVADVSGDADGQAGQGGAQGQIRCRAGQASR
jgi:hypothetical protein